MNKTLLVLSGNPDSVPGIKIAKDMGLHVVVADSHPSAPAKKFCDDVLAIDVHQVDETLSAVEHYHNNVRFIDGVISFVTDVSLCAARIAALLKLPGISVESAQLISDKLAMKQCFNTHGISAAWYSEVADRAQLEAFTRTQGLPLILRPATNTNASGVLHLTKGIDLDWAFNHVKQRSLNGKVLVEKFVSGQQVSAESLIIDGEVHTPAYCDRNYEYLKRYAPYMVANGGNLPSLLPDDVQDTINAQIKKAAAGLGIVNGVLKSEIVVQQLQPFVLDITAGLNGGYFSSHQIPLSTGVNAAKLAIHIALGEDIEPKALKPKFMRAVSQRYLFAEPGRVVEIAGVDLARDLLCVEEVMLNVKVGDVVKAPEGADSWAAMVIAVGDNRDQANKHALDALNHITLETQT